MSVPCHVCVAQTEYRTYGMFYVLPCPVSVLPCSGHVAHIRQGWLPIWLPVCFWGNTVLADFPSVVRRGGPTVWHWSEETHSSSLRCTVHRQSLLPWQRRSTPTHNSMAGEEADAFLWPLGSPAMPSPPLWLALAKPWLSFAWFQQLASQCTHTPVQGRP